MIYGTRYPTLAFYTGGSGQAEDGMPPQPFETFCYDSALNEAKIQDFNIIPYSSVLPPELFGNIVPVTKVEKNFKHGAVLEVIMAGSGSNREDHKAIASGIGIVWGKKNGKFVGGWAAEYIEYFDTFIDDDIAKAHAEMWLTKSLKHELELRDTEQYSDFQFFHNFVNIKQAFGYSLTALGFLNFENAPATELN